MALAPLQGAPAFARTFCSSLSSSLPAAGGGRKDQWDRRGVAVARETLRPSQRRRKGIGFPRLAGTSHHKLESLKQIYSLTVLETRSSKSRHQLTNVPLRALGKSTLLANPCSAGSRFPWASGSTSILSMLNPHVLPCPSAWLLERHTSLDLKPVLNPNDHFSGHLASSHLQRPLLWVKLHSEFWTWVHGCLSFF